MILEDCQTSSSVWREAHLSSKVCGEEAGRKISVEYKK